MEVKLGLDIQVEMEVLALGQEDLIVPQLLPGEKMVAAELHVRRALEAQDREPGISFY